MSLWVLIEGDGDIVRSVSLELLARGRDLGVPTTAVVVGEPGLVQAVTGHATDIVFVGAPRKADCAAATLSDLVERRRPSLVVAGATSFGRDLMPRLAARLNTGLAAGCTSLDRDGDTWTVRRPVQGGKAYVELAATAATLLATVRPNTYSAGPGDVAAPSVEHLDLDTPPTAIEHVAYEPTAGGRVPLEEAQVVVAAGRGMGSAEDFGLIEDLADALNGAVGATRAVVDSQWRPVEEQVGKSGKTVSPKLYFAIGISGAIHHVMGMDTAGTVVAINSDPTALIFQYADLGLVGDARQVVPALTERLRS
jgi:electron transfer flavoprotein alpha subunit